jgi:anti-repressor protein
MSNQLIPVFTGTIAGVPAQLVNARELHTFLGIGKMFANWIKDRIKQYGFQENQDYICVAKTGNGENRGFQPIEYHITLNMAKELSMVERNAKGKEARRYFIECERLVIEASQARIPPKGEQPDQETVLPSFFLTPDEHKKLDLENTIAELCKDLRLTKLFKMSIRLHLLRTVGTSPKFYTPSHIPIIDWELNYVIREIIQDVKNGNCTEAAATRLLALGRDKK